MSSRITSKETPLGESIAPQSVAAAGTANSGWMKVDDCINVQTLVKLGALGGGTVTLTWQQANTAAGGGAKALSWTGGSSAVNNASLVTDDDPDKLDINNGFAWVRATLTNVGGTGALVSAVIQKCNPRFTT